MNHTSFASSVIDAPTERVWAFFRDFNGLAAFHPAIVESRLEPGPDAHTVGAIRYLTLSDGFVREKLLKLDEPSHELEYSIVETSMPVRNYVAGVKLFPVTDSGKTFAQWWANFTTEGVELQPVAASISEHVFAAGFRALADKLRAR
ncbi:SRPBCC family protein [Burkholderia oklahomensis]|uniref:Polyketide cyclase / dehydrase and lipid transport family protein n=1 Tax=Burkholderia oklahomensis TaxID=342113 RepID=A0AAI8BC66_9BURK|nr:SRPBCC family protein [Burkholderia oklahomensis]AIO69607.1 polyketide cyclase / dehydrase and lipid transport family protein [Burkholderia oklahomensis]AJX35048.1 polyketide cyclase / dehydrase and lipid transport family protein [Burkholderia oklahomensis C6786]AOI38968.1 polyketide cyclase [Burkholderia oklahomensis EO147]AOI48669.1 polyketide cyclase [Burkholderia oklahomensis C6786]KUY47455.1 polyketide cyclase [Burkholderia oklahomensis C6786]